MKTDPELLRRIPEINKVVVSLSNFSYSGDGAVAFPELSVSLLKGNAEVSGQYNLSSRSGQIDATYKEIEYKGEALGGKATLLATDGNFFLKTFWTSPCR